MPVQLVAILYLVLLATTHTACGSSWCSKEGHRNNKILYISTLDGSLTALNFSGNKLWQYNSNQPLYSSSLSYLEASTKFPNIIPGLDKNVYHWDGNELTRLPLSVDNLLEQPYFSEPGLVRSGARVKDDVALNVATGKVLYECTQFSCDKYDNHSLVGKIDRLLVTSQRSTVREANSLTGDEIWNFTLSQIQLSLIEGEESIESDFSCLLRDETHLSIFTDTLQGRLVVSDSNRRISWDYKFASPIVNIWLHHGGKLEKVQPSPLASLTNSYVQPSLILGVWKHQYFIQPVIQSQEMKLIEQQQQGCTLPDFDIYLPHLPSTQDDSSPSTSLALYREDLALLKSLYTNGPNGLALYFHHKFDHMTQDSCSIKEENSSDEQSQSSTPAPVLDTPSYFFEWVKFFLKYGCFAVCVLAVNKLRRYHMARRYSGSRRRLTSSSCSSDDDVFTSDDNMTYSNSDNTVDQNNLLNLYHTGGRRTSSISTLKPNGTYSLLPIVEEESDSNDTNILRQESVSRFEMDYDKLGILGKGGFGVVYHVLNKFDKNEYALKRIKLPTKKFARDKVMREVHALAQLDHPAIVRYFSSWVERAPHNWNEHEDWDSTSQLNSGETGFSPVSSVLTVGSKSVGPSSIAPSSVGPSTVVPNGIPLSSLTNSLSELPPLRSLTNESRNSSFIVEFKEDSKTNDAIHFLSSESIENESSGLMARSRVTSDNTGEDSHRRYTPDSGQKFVDPPSFLFIQMQLCQKQSLKDWLRNNIHNRERIEILRQFEQILNAVVYVHNKDLMHRDLKPSNIFFSLNGNIKIGDFGLVTGNIIPDTHKNSFISLKQIADEENRHTGNIGTHFYISPEQINGLQYDQKVDVFSLGVIFFELNYPFITEMERAKVLENLRKNRIPNEFKTHLKHEAVLVEWLMSPVNKRPSALEVKNSEKLNELRQIVNISDFTYIPKL